MLKNMEMKLCMISYLYIMKIYIGEFNKIDI